MRYWSAPRIKPPSRALIHALSMLSAAGLSGPASAAAISWTPNADGFWDIATNWSSNPALPGAADDVTLNVAGLVTVTYRSLATTINSLTSQENFVVSGGSLTVANAFSNAGDTTISGGSLTLNGTSNLASLTQNSTLSGSGLVTVSGASSWIGGTQTGSGATQFNAALSISGNGTKQVTGTRVVTLNSTTTWSGNTGGTGNTISLASTATVDNAGSFSDSNAFNTSITGGTFNNSGNFDKQSNTTTTIGSVFNNTGTVNVNAGTMLMNAGGTSTGVFNLAAGALLEFRNGTHTLNNVTTSGAGTLQISTDNVGADALVTINGGTLTSGFLLSGSTMNGTDQTFQGPSTWTGGTITGTAAQSTTFSGALTISGANTKVLSGGRSINAGNTTWTGNTANGNNVIAISQAGAFNNTGTFTDTNAFDSAINAGGGGGIFNNSGTFNKQSNTTTSIGTVFNSTGSVNVNAGTLLLNGGGTDSGVFNVASGAKLEFRNGSHTLNNVTTSGAGTFEISTENVGADATVAVNGGMHTTAFVLSGSILTGTSHTFQGLATWSGGTITGTAAASTTFANDLTISGPNNKTLSGGRSVNAGNTLWTGNTGNGNNAIGISGASAFNSSGTFTDANAFDSAINVGNGGGAFNNNGTFNKQSNTTTSIGVAFNSSGTVNVNAGTLLMNGGGTDSGVFNIANGAKLEFRNGNHTLNNVTTSGAGTFEISTENVGADAIVAVNGGTHTTRFVLSGSTMAGSDATFQGLATWTGGTISGAAATTFSNDVAISGPNLKVIVGGRTVNLNATTTWSGNTADNNNAIRFWNGATINNNGTFNDTNAFASFIEHNVGGPHNFNNIGTYNKQSNTITTVDLGVVFNNSGTLNLNSGTMRFVSGTQGPTGTVNVASGATFQHDAASTVGNLITAGNLVLAGSTVTVFIDYNNANFGVGDAFNRRANVSTTGAGNRLVAAGDANQGINGANIANGTSANPTLVIGNVRVGANTFNYDIANVGTTGPALRGAIQTGVNGANISDARLSGSGVTAGNWGPVTTGNSVSRNVTITVGTAGVFAPLAGQAVNILNNFENTRSQLLTITSSAGAAAYNPAAASVTPNPVVLANQRVGTGLTQALTVANTAPAGAFTEGLNASFAGTTGNATVNGGAINLLAGGASNNTAMRIGVDASSAGAKSGSATLNFVSDGTGTSGLTNLALAPQTVNVSGNVYQVAAGQIVTAPLNFGTVQVGQSVSQVLSISNIAAGAAGFVEDLNASFGSSGDARISGSGSLSGILAGTSSTAANGTMTVSVNTGVAGVIASSIGVNFTSAGAVNGVSNGLGTLGVGSESYGVSGTIQATVINTASPVINNSPINLGNVRVGDASPTAFVSVTNQATTPPQAALNATISGNAPVTASGSFNLLNPGATNSSSLQVGMNTASAGAINGTATIGFVSDASNVGGCAPNCQLNLPNGNVVVTGGVYQVAQPNLPTTVNLGNVHVGGTLSQAIAIGNTSVAPAGYQEGLDAAVGGTSGGATGSGSITNLAAGGSSNAITVGLAGIGAGNQSGQVNLNLASNGTGTSGLAPLSLGTQAVTVNAVGYTLAQASVTPAPVTLANQRVGGTLTQALTVANVAPSSAFTETLSASFGGNSGNATHNGGSVSGLAGGASNNAALAVGVDTSAAGARSGTVTVNLASSEVNGSGLGTTALAPQTVNVSGNVYQVAAGQIVTAPLNFGTVQVGQSVSQVLSISNIATGAAGFVEDLNARFGASSGTGSILISGTGQIANLVAGGTNSSGMTVNVNTAAAGTVNGAIAVDFFSAGAVNSVSNGLGELGVGSASFGVVGTIQGLVINQAVPVVNTPTIALGNVRVGAVAPTQSVSVTNQATTPPQAALNASISAAAPLTSTGSVNLLLPGATDNASLQVGMTTAAAGSRNGTATLSFVSDASNVGGCAPNCQLALPSQTVNITGGVYQVAQPSVAAAVNLGNFRIGSAPSQTIAIGNTSVAPAGYQEGLDASIGGASGSAIASGGPITNLAQGGTSNAISVGINNATAVAGANSGTVTLNVTSNGSGTSGLAPLALAPQSVTVTGTGFNAAAGNVSPSPVVLANQRVGGTGSQVLTVTNTAAAGSFSEDLNASFVSSTGNATGSGAISGRLAGTSNTGTGSMAVGVNTSAAGARSGSVTIDYQTAGTVNGVSNGLGVTGVGSQTINVSGNVYQVAAGQIVTAPLNFGTVQVGQLVSQNLVIGNTATGAAGYVEDLNASFGASGDARISGSGSLSGILAGTSSTVANGTMTVSVNTGVAGVIASSIGVNFTSAGAVNGASNGLGTLGVGSANYGVSGTIQANVVDQAQPVINGVANPGAVSVNLGAVRINTAANQALTVLNQATGNQQAALNGSIATNGAPVLAGGSFNLLAPGATSGALSVGVDTSAAGVRAGSATVSLVSDASNLGNCAPNCQVTLPNQTVNVSADVYRLANPVLNTGTVTIAARVGDATAASQGVSITNASPDIYTEGLRVNVTGTSGNAQSNGGAIANLAAQGTDSASIRVGLNSTAVAGVSSGTVNLGYVSTGAGTTGAADLPIGAGLVTVTGKVYTPAAAQIGNTAINFGVVHVGDSVAPVALSVANIAPVTGLNDTLQASFGAVSGPFSGTGSIAGLVAGGSNGTSMTVGLNTSTAGVYNGSGSVNLASHNPDMTDLALSPANLIFAAQINNYANPEFVKTGGAGSLSGGGTTFALDLGDLLVGSGVTSASLGVLNDVLGPADRIDGAFNLSGVDDFALSGFSPFAGLDAGQLFSGLLASFAATSVGSFDDTVVLLARAYNASGYEQQFNLTLLLHADVLPSGAVPEPTTIALLGAAFVLLAYVMRRRNSRNR